jgi:hypothetical protein
VQRSFQSYGNPDWQGQQMVNVDTMHDAVEYSTGWTEFWLQRAEDLGEWGQRGAAMAWIGLLASVLCVE